MAKHPDPATERVYQTATKWIDTCLDADGSLFTPGSAIWTTEHLADLFDRIWVHGDTTPGSNFFEKLQRQLNEASPNIVQLAAEDQPGSLPVDLARCALCYDEAEAE